MMIREPTVAGQFYSGDPKALRRIIRSFVEETDSPIKARAVIVPHAGYVYSGSVAGKVFSSIALPERMILLGPNHTGRREALALSPAGAWRTPLGMAEIDADMNRYLLAECPSLREDSFAHLGEHSIEVQIPFIQFLQPDFRFSAICVGTADYSFLESLGHAMARVIRSFQEPILLVASSDMTHYESVDTAARQDQYAIDRILTVDPRGLYRVVIEKNISMCGFAPATAVLIACRDLGSTKGSLICYSNSGEASRDYDRVVAYAGIAVM